MLKGEIDLDLDRLPYFKYDLDWLDSIERDRDLEGAGLRDMCVYDFEWCLPSSTRFTFLGGTGKDISSKQKHKTVIRILSLKKVNSLMFINNKFNYEQ